LLHWFRGSGFNRSPLTEAHERPSHLELFIIEGVDELDQFEPLDRGVMLGDLVILLERVGEAPFKPVDIHSGQSGDLQQNLHGRPAVAVDPAGEGRALHIEDLGKLYDGGGVKQVCNAVPERFHAVNIAVDCPE